MNELVVAFLPNWVRAIGFISILPLSPLFSPPSRAILAFGLASFGQLTSSLPVAAVGLLPAEFLVGAVFAIPLRALWYGAEYFIQLFDAARGVHFAEQNGLDMEGDGSALSHFVNFFIWTLLCWSGALEKCVWSLIQSYQQFSALKPESYISFSSWRAILSDQCFQALQSAVVLFFPLSLVFASIELAFAALQIVLGRGMLMAEALSAKLLCAALCISIFIESSTISGLANEALAAVAILSPPEALSGVR